MLLRTNDDSESGWDKVWSLARVNRCRAVAALLVCLLCECTWSKDQGSPGPERHCQAACLSNGLQVFIWLDVEWEQSVGQPVSRQLCTPLPATKEDGMSDSDRQSQHPASHLKVTISSCQIQSGSGTLRMVMRGQVQQEHGDDERDMAKACVAGGVLGDAVARLDCGDERQEGEEI